MKRQQKLTAMFQHFDETLGGRYPTLDEVAAQLDGAFSVKYLRNIRMQYKQRCELRNDPNARAIQAKFGPTPMLIEVIEAGKLMGLKWSLSRYQMVRQLIEEANAANGGSEQEKPYNLRLYGVDVELFEKIVAMYGMKRPETFSLLIRSFVIAAAKMQINPLECARQARKLNAKDAKRISKVLDVNLKGLLG